MKQTLMWCLNQEVLGHKAQNKLNFAIENVEQPLAGVIWI